MKLDHQRTDRVVAPVTRLGTDQHFDIDGRRLGDGVHGCVPHQVTEWVSDDD